MLKLTTFNTTSVRAALVALAITATSPAAMAAIQCASPNLDVPDSIDGVYLNFVTGSTATGGAGWDFNPYNNGAGLTFYGAASPQGILATGTAGTSAEAQALTSGASIAPTPATGFYNQFQTRGTAFQTAGTRFVGVKFTNEATSAINYGWVEIVSGSTAGFPATITRYCYDDTGAAITAGTTPVSLQQFSVD